MNTEEALQSLTVLNSKKKGMFSDGTIFPGVIPVDEFDLLNSSFGHDFTSRESRTPCCYYDWTKCEAFCSKKLLTAEELPNLMLTDQVTV